MRTFNLGIVGFGTMGRRVADAITHDPSCNLRVVGIVDPALQEGPDPFAQLRLESLADLLTLRSLDCVYIASPPASHLALLTQVAEAGKAVLCEKPLAANVWDAEACVAVVTHTRVPAAVNFPYATSLVLPRLRTIIESGALGRVLKCRLQLRFSSWPRQWQSNAGGWLVEPAQGGFAREVLSHFIFLCSRLFGAAHIESASSEKTPTGIEQKIQAVIHFGTTLTEIDAEVSGHVEDFNRLSIIGSGGTVVLTDWYHIEFDGKRSERLAPLPGLLAALPSFLRADAPHELASLREAASVVRVVEALRN